jgi:phage terminase large subunit
MNKNDLSLITLWIDSPIRFISDMWGLEPQPLKEEFKEQAAVAPLQDYKEEWFEDFQKGKHITWQQWVILLAVERAIKGQCVPFITAESGHGVGKSTVLAWLILWFLFTRYNAQIPCTAPTSSQMHDILWKEVAIWLNKLPDIIKKKFVMTGEYIRIEESPDTWFARARTAKRETPEALAGVHGEHVMFVIDEASGVPEEVFNVAEGALTGENVLVIMISNHTRLRGYFHDSHTRFKHHWQCLSFDSRESPIVDLDFVKRIIDRHGASSNEFRIRVMGKAPKEDMLDEKGYMPLFTELEILQAQRHTTPFGEKRLGCDVAEAGSNFTSFVLRQTNIATILRKYHQQDTMVIAGDIVNEYGTQQLIDENIFIDNLGVGKGVFDRLKEQQYRVSGVRVSESADDADQFANRRAQNAWRARTWIKSGGLLEPHKDWGQLLDIKYKVSDSSGKIVLMSKQEMMSNSIESPDVADAFFLTFDRPDNKVISKTVEQRREEKELLKQFESHQRPRVSIGYNLVKKYPQFRR